MSLIKGLIKKVLFFAIFIFALILTPTLILDATLQAVSNFISRDYEEYGESNGLPTSLEDEEQWASQIDTEYIGEFLTKENLTEAIDIEKGNRLADLYVPVKVTNYDTHGRKTTRYERNKYKLSLFNSTLSYTFPWQIITASELYKMFDPYFDTETKSVKEIIKEGLQTTYFGLYGDESTIVDKEALSDVDEFLYNRVVTKEIHRKIRIKDVDYYWIETEHGLEKKRKVTYRTRYEDEKNIKEFPLPYFDKISTYNEEIDFEYKYERRVNRYTTTKVSGNKTITETHTITYDYPVIEKTIRRPNNERLISTMFALDFGQSDVATLAQYVRMLPDGITVSDELNEIGTLLAQSDDFFWSSTNGLDINEILENLNGKKYTQDNIIELSEALLGVHYFWGGKYNAYGVNPEWGNIKFEPTFSRYQNYGLDCSGYVDWVYYQLTGAVLSEQWGVRGQVENSILIDREDLQIGDLGFYHIYDKEYSGNHVGIFVGRDIDGVELFIHAGGSTWSDPGHPRGQVIISKLNQPYKGYKPVKFKHFGRPTINYTLLENSNEEVTYSTGDYPANIAKN